jgi:hypothetical protein
MLRTSNCPSSGDVLYKQLTAFILRCVQSLARCERYSSWWRTVKVKVPHTRRPRGRYTYSYTVSALEGVVGQHHASAALPPEKTRYPLYRRLSGPHGPTGRVRKISPPLRGTVQPVASRYRLSYPDLWWRTVTCSKYVEDNLSEINY